jgi:hypothetical protein
MRTWSSAPEYGLAIVRSTFRDLRGYPLSMSISHKNPVRTDEY